MSKTLVVIGVLTAALWVGSISTADARNQNNGTERMSKRTLVKDKMASNVSSGQKEARNQKAFCTQAKIEALRKKYWKVKSTMFEQLKTPGFKGKQNLVNKLGGEMLQISKELTKCLDSNKALGPPKIYERPRISRKV